MKPDYKNWMPKGMVLGTLSGAVECFGMSALCGCTGLIKNKKAKAAATDALLLSGIAFPMTGRDRCPGRSSKGSPNM